MDQGERERLRCLAVWLACRRETEQALTQLTRYGPSASQQVAIHLVALRELLAQEAAAFAAVEAASGEVTQRALPGAPEDEAPATVHLLDLARERREQA